MQAQVRIRAAVVAVLTTSFCSIPAIAAPGKPPASQRTAGAFLHLVSQAVAGPLDDRRVQAMVKVPTASTCTNFGDTDANGTPILSCSYRPAKPQAGPVQLVSYAAAGIEPGVMNVGSIEWKFDRKRICVKEEDLEQAFGVRSLPARFWNEPEASDGNLEARQYRSYDFRLEDGGLEKRTIAVFEIEGCARSMRLAIHAPTLR